MKAKVNGVKVNKTKKMENCFNINNRLVGVILMQSYSAVIAFSVNNMILAVLFLFFLLMLLIKPMM